MASIYFEMAYSAVINSTGTLKSGFYIQLSLDKSNSQEEQELVPFIEVSTIEVYISGGRILHPNAAEYKMSRGGYSIRIFTTIFYVDRSSRC